MLKDSQNRLLLYPRLVEFGVSYGDLLGIEKCLEEHGFEAWSRALLEHAEAYHDRAVDREEEGRIASAASFHRRACDYFHFSGLRSASFEMREEGRLRSEQSFDSWRRCARPPLIVEDFECLGARVKLHCSGWSDRMVLLIGGLDSSKECELWYFSRFFASRGLHVVYVDFPGQGQLLGKLTLLDHGDAYSRAIVDHIGRRSDGACLAVFGVSLGGYLAFRLGALCPDVAAVISLGGFFDSAVFDNLRPDAKPHLHKALTSSPGERLEEVQKRMTLANAADRLDPPALVIHGGDDHLVPREQVRRIAEWAPRAQVRVIDGAEHVATSRFSTILDDMADWTESRLKSAH